MMCALATIAIIAAEVPAAVLLHLIMNAEIGEGTDMTVNTSAHQEIEAGDIKSVSKNKPIKNIWRYKNVRRKN